MEILSIRARLIFSLLISLLILRSTFLVVAEADDSTPVVLRVLAHGKTNKLQGLTFSPNQPPLEMENEGKLGQKVFTRVKGRFQRADCALLSSDQVILPPQSDGSVGRDFEIRVELESIRTPVQFTVVTPYGKTETLELVVVDPAFLAQSKGGNETPSFGSTLVVGLGVASISYSETQLASFSEIALTPKLSYQVSLAKNWDLGITSFMNAAILSDSIPDEQARFLGINGRIGYSLPLRSRDWNVSIAAGFYYTTMITPVTNFGYRNMFGPQLFPVVRRSLNSTDVLSAYLKFSPISQGFDVSFGSHEIGTGLSYTHHLANHKAISATLDYANDNLQFNTILSIQVTSLTLGAAYSF